MNKGGKIFILTGPVQNGKTTALNKWIVSQSDVGGILTPDIDGRRYIKRLRDNQLFTFQINETSERNIEVQEIGRFIFLNKAFEIANATIHEDLEGTCEYVIIDELGKLELKGLGLSKSMRKVSDLYAKHELYKKVIIVVRDYLLEEAIRYYSLEDATVIQFTETEKLSF